MRPSHVLLTGICAAGLLCSATAQETAPEFKSKAEMVLLPTVVTKDGKPLTGLTKDDFTLLHDGKAEEVASFEEVDAVPASVELPPLPPHTVQNFAEGNRHQDVVILLLDFLNGSFSSAARMRSYLSDMTKQFAATHTPVTVLLLSDRGLVQVHSFSSDPENLTKAVDQWLAKAPVVNDQTSGHVTWASPASFTDISNSTSMLNQFARLPGYASRWLDRVKMTAQSVEYIAEAFRGIPGRKKLIWMSISFPSFVMTGQRVSDQPADPSDVLKQMRAGDLGRQARASLSDANIAVYPIDSNGPVNPSWEEHFSGNHGGERLDALSSRTIPGAELEVASDPASLIDVAQKTGGLPCVDLPTTCIKKIQADANHYYLLGFYLHGESRPGWHKLKVSVKEAGATTRTRDGFEVGGHAKPGPNENGRADAKGKAKTAQTEQRSAEADKERVNSILAAPLDYTGVPLQLSWSELPPEGKQRQVELVLTSPPKGITPDVERKLNLDYLAFVRPVGKTEGQTYPDTLTASLSPEQERGLLEVGFKYRHKLSLAPGRYEVRVLLRDNLTQKIGTVSTVINLTPAKAD